jgi:integrase
MSVTSNMVSVRYRHVYEDVDRHGNVRLYFWRKGRKKVRIRGAPGTTAFQERYEELMQQAKAGDDAAGILRPTPGTYRWLCAQYFGSKAFRSLDARTQKGRRCLLEETFREPTAPGASTLFADFPLGRMSAKAVRVLRDRKAEYPKAGNAQVKAIRVVFAWAIAEEIDGVTMNPARDVPALKGRQDGFHSWTADEIKQFGARYEIGTRERLALALLLYTGLRRSDIVLVGRQHVRDGWLKMTLQKNRRRTPVTIEIPMLPALREVIDASPTGDLIFLATRFGRPFTVDRFGNWFRMKCNEAGLPHCSAHGLRKAAAAMAAQNGGTTHQLMSVSDGSP